MSTLEPLAHAPREVLSAIKGVFTDIDDTLTTQGKIDAAVLDAIGRLRATGLIVIPITGRPGGWCDMIARQWPVDGVVGENGAFYFRYETDKRMLRRYADSESVRAEKRERLAAIGKKILAAVPGSALAADQPYRESDLAIDFREDVRPLSTEAVQEIVRLFESHGATAKVSSIHVNGWFGDYNKLTMTQTMMREVFRLELDKTKTQYVFIGDSPNDAPMFGYFPNAVGVANVRGFAAQCEALPRWVTERSYGAGFVELAEAVLAART